MRVRVRVRRAIYGTVHVEVEVVELLPVRVGLRGVDRHACAGVGPRVGVGLGWLSTKDGKIIVD